MVKVSELFEASPFKGLTAVLLYYNDRAKFDAMGLEMDMPDEAIDYTDLDEVETPVVMKDYTFSISEELYTEAKTLAESDKEVMADNLNEVIESLLDIYVDMGGLRNVGIELGHGDAAWFDFTHGLLKNNDK